MHPKFNRLKFLSISERIEKTEQIKKCLLSLYDKEVNSEKSQMIRCETISELQRNPKKKID